MSDQLSGNLTAYHFQVASELQRRYQSLPAPEGLFATLAWHWQQAEAWPQAAVTAIRCAEHLIRQRDISQAQRWCERALEMQSRMEPRDLALELRSLLLIWTVLDLAGQHREALEYGRRMLRLAESHALVETQAAARLAIGRSQQALGNLAAAEADLARTLDLARQHVLPALEADALFHLGKVRILQGRHFEAIQHFTYAQAHEQALEDQGRMARVFTGLGDVYRVLGATRDALAHYTRALQLEASQQSVAGAAILQEKLALTYIDLGRLGEALEAEEHSLRLRQQLNDQVGVARAFTVLGSVLARQQDHEAALRRFEQGLLIEQNLQGLRGMAMIHSHMGDSHRALGRIDQANDCYAQCLALAQEQQDQIGLALIHARMGELAVETANDVLALLHLNESLAIRQQLGHSDETRDLQRRIARIRERIADAESR